MYVKSLILNYGKFLTGLVVEPVQPIVSGICWVWQYLPRPWYRPKKRDWILLPHVQHAGSGWFG
jgi:hypothetical protein